MNTNIIKIKCPFCGVVLSVKDEPDLEKRNVTCPVCKQKSAMKDFKKVEERQVDRTEYPDMGELQRHSMERTMLNVQSSENNTLGRLQMLPAGSSYQLKPGRNVVGRKCEKPPYADFMLPTKSNRMSRQHLMIEVRKIQGKGFMHYASLCGQKANATFVGDNRLEVGDCLVLNDGDIIRLPDMPDVSVKFEIADGEKTMLDL